MSSTSALQMSSYIKAFSSFGIILVGICCFMFLSLLVFPFISVILLDLKFNNRLCLQLLYRDCLFPFLFLSCSKLLRKTLSSSLWICITDSKRLQTCPPPFPCLGLGEKNLPEYSCVCMFKCVHETSALAQDVKHFKQNGLYYLWAKLVWKWCHRQQLIVLQNTRWIKQIFLQFF